MRPVNIIYYFKIAQILVILLVLTPVVLLAQTSTWNGSVSSDWFNASNWSNGVPGPSTTAQINNIAAGNNQPTLSSSTSIGGLSMGSNNQTLTIASGTTLTIANNLVTGNSANLIGNGVSLVIGGNMTLGNDATFTGSSSLSVSGSLSVANGKVFNADFNTVNVGGTLSLTGRINLFSAQATVDALNINNNGILNVQSGNVTINNTSTNNGTILIGDGVFTILGNLTHTSSAYLEVQTGTVNVGSPGPPVVGGNFTQDGGSQFVLNQGKFNVYGNSTFTGGGDFSAGDGDILFEGNVAFNGGSSFNGGNSTVSLSGDVTLSTNSNQSVTFYNLIVQDGTNVTANINVTVTNNMTVDPTGSYDHVNNTTLNVYGTVTGEPAIDVNRPYVVSVEVVNQTRLRIFFNTAFNGNPISLIPGTGTNAAERTANYEVTNNGAVPSSATLVNPNTVEIEFNPATFTIQDNTQYTLWVKNLRIQENNSVSGQISDNHFKLFGGSTFTVPQPLMLDYYPGGLDNTNLQLWLDVADESTRFTNPSGTALATNGQTIARINDKSPFGRHAIQTNTALRPTLDINNAFNGRPSLIFNNAESLPFDGTFLAGTAYTLGFFVDRSIPGGRNIYLGGTGATQNSNLHLFWGTNNRLEFNHWNNDFGFAVPAYTGSLEGEIHTFNLNPSLSTNARSIWRNGALLGSGGTNATLASMAGASIGAYQNNEFFSGRFGETYMYNRILNTTERIILDNYFAAKWGAALTPAARFHMTPTNFGNQLVGIGRNAANDFVAQTAFTSGGLGLSSSTAEFLSVNGNYLMAAHNGATGLSTATIFTTSALYERPNRVWFADITKASATGDITLSFDLDILDVNPTNATGQYALLFNANEDDFSVFDNNVVLSDNPTINGSVVSFTIPASQLEDGYVTLGFFITVAAADPDETTITAQPTVIEADGASTSLITVQARFQNGVPLSTGGDVVTLSSTAGTLGSVSDNGDGTYTAVLTSANTTGTAEVSGTINGDAIAGTATVTFSGGAPAPEETLITAADSQLVANGTDETTITVQLRDVFGDNLNTGGATVELFTTAGTLSAVTDNNNGTYTATLTASLNVSTATVTATVNGSPATASVQVSFTAGTFVLSASILEAVPTQITANGTSQSTIVLQLRDANGNLVGTGGETVAFSTTQGNLSAVNDIGNGTYTVLLTSSTSTGLATVSATVNSNAVPTTAQVEFVGFDILRYYPGGLTNSNLQVWFDAADPAYNFSDVAGTTPANFGDRVALLRDKSPNARHAQQNDVARRPVRSNTGAFGGRPSLVFNNTEFLPFNGSFLAGTDYTVTFLLDRSFGGSGRNIFFGGTGTSNNNNLHMLWNGSTTLEHHHFGNNYTMTVPAYTGNLSGEIHTYNLNTAVATPARRTWRNGTQIGSGGSNATLTTMNGAALGRYQTASFFQGRMGEVIMHNRVLNTTEFNILQNYLSARWGVAIDGAITYYTAPNTDFHHQLVGIGRTNSTDVVLRTAFTSGGLGFTSDGFSFLNASQRYIMAAHNNANGLASASVSVGETAYERWNRSWYVQKSVVTTGGNLGIEFDFLDYALPLPDQDETYVLLYHPTDPNFASSGVQTITGTASFTSVNRLRFVVNADNLSNGYYTLGRSVGTVTFFSITSGNFNEASTWSVTGHNGQPHSASPGPNSTVVIGGNNGTDHTVTLTANFATQSSGDITVTDTGDGAGILQLGTNLITGTGTFTLQAGATLRIGSPAGITATASTGNIRTTSRSFSSDAIYVYNGSNAQITGTGLPAQIRELQVDNAAGVSLTNNLRVTGETRLENGNLTVGSGRALVSATIQYNGGLLRALRDLWVPASGTPGGWRLFASPINTDYANLFSELLTQGFSGSDLGVSSSLIPNVLWYDEPFQGTDNQRWRAPTSASEGLVPGRGLFAYVFGNIPTDSRYNQSSVTLEVIGQENTGDITLPVTFTPNGDQGWNLVGNPYLSTIYWNDEDGWTKTNIGNSIYVWDQQSNSGNGAFLEWNGVTGWGNGFIKPFQGFWVKANDTNPVLELKSAARSSTVAGTFYRRANNPELELQIITADSLKGRAIVMFTEEGRTGLDPLDAYRLQSLSDTYVDLFSITQDGDRMAINNLPVRFARTVNIPMDLDASINGGAFNGEVMLSLKRFDQIPPDWDVNIVDRETGQTYSRDDLIQGVTISLKTNGRRAKAASEIQEAFTFDLPPGPVADRAEGPVMMKSNPSRSRFILNITPLNAPSDVPTKFALSQNYPNPFNPSTTVPFQLAADGDVRIEVYDITGRRLAVLLDEFRQAGFYEVSWNAGMYASGIYIYRMITVEGVYTSKMTLIK